MKRLFSFFLFFSFLLIISSSYSASNNTKPHNFEQSKIKLRQIYQSNPTQKEFYCGCPFVFDGKISKINLQKCGYQIRKNAQRANRIEWEHVMPAENFGHHLQCWINGGRKNCKKDPAFNKIESDMHNLQPAIGEVNGDRSNYPYSAMLDNPQTYGQCRSAVDFKIRRFEPRPEIRGVIARTYLYMSKQHKIRLSKKERQLMNVWNKKYVPTEWECNRNDVIGKIQGNKNGFITAQCPVK